MAENLNTLYYALGLDDYQMQEGLKKAIQNLSVLDDEFNRINKSIEETFGKKIKNAPIHNEIKGLRAELHGMEKDWNNLTLAERRGTKGQELRAKYEALRKEAGNLNNSLARLYSESQKTASGQKGLAAQFGLVNKELTLQSRLMSNINTLFTTYVSIFAVKSFIQNLARVRGEFENQQIALRAILRDAEAADRIFGQIKSFAVISPFEFKDLVGYAKQLSAFQVPVNELFETTKRLADVSAGLGVGMDRIILAYGQVRSAAVLRGQELRQFTEAGIPLVDELAKKFSELEGRVVSAGDVFEKISNRMVSFGMVKEIFEDMTNEGGIFYMMQEKQAESLKGKIANLADAYDIMLNDIGEANDGILKGGVEGISALFSNWEKVWKILKTVIATYGTYKAVLISVTAIQRVNMLATMAAEYLNMARNLGIATANMIAFNRAALMNPYTLVASAIGAVVGSLILFRQEAQSTSDIMNGLNESVTELSSHGEDTQKLISSYEELAKKSNRSQEENNRLNKIINEIAATVPNATKAINDYNGVLSLNINKVREYSEEEKKSLQKGLQAQIDVATKRREELIKERDFMQRQIAEGAKIQEFYTLRGKIETKDEINTEEIAQYNQKVLQLYTDIDNLNNSIRDSRNAISGLFAQPKAPDDFSDSIKELNKQISDLKGFDPNILEGAKIKDTSKVIKDATQDIVTLFKTYEEEKERISKAPSLYSKEDIDNSNTMYSLYKKIKEEILGIKDDENKKGSTKDPNAERLKEQIDLIKKAQAQYEKYLQIMSPDEALNAIRTDQQFMALDVQFEPNKVREGFQMVMNDIGKLPQSPELEKLKKSIQAAFTDIDYTNAKKNFDKFLSDLTKELDTYKDKFNIYEQILNLGGSEELAINLSGVESGNLVDSIKSKILKSVQEVRPTVTIETILDQKDLPEQVQKLVDAANKAAEDAQKNNLLSAAKLLNIDSPEGMGMAFDLGNIVKEYSVELLKLQNELRDALNAEGITEEQKKQIQNNVKLAIDANTKIYADKTRKLGAVYVQEQIEIAGLGEAFKNMSTASYESLLKMLEITENAKKDLISGADAISGFKNVGFGDNESQRLATKEPIFAQLFNSEDLLQFQDLLEDIETLLYNEDVSTITTKLGINSDDINKLKLWVSQQKGAAIAVGNTQREINKFRIDRIVKMLGDLSQNLDGAIDGIRNLAGAFGKELDEMTEGSLNLLSTIVSSTTGAISSITSTTQWAGEAMKGASTSAATAIKTVEKASVILAVIGAVLQVATAIAGMFSKDKKLDEEIKASQLRVEKLKNSYSEIERLISRNLGDAQNIDLGLGDVNARLTEVNQQLEDLRAKSQTNIFFKIRYSSNIKELEKEQKKLQAYNEGGTYGLQRQNLIEQQEELIKQRQAEIDKKKTDPSKVADYENQINELDDAIRHFAEDTLKELYNIDLKDWASQIGDALFDAWKKGEDGATAFKNKIGQLMGQVMNEILKIRILEPMMKEVGDKLFGTDGKSGYFGSDFNLTHNELSDIAKTLASAKDKTQKYSEAMNRLEEEINKYGLSMKDVDTESGGLIKEAQNLTEDTGSLLVSYINAIRASVALQEIYMKSIDTNIAGIYQAMGGSPNITTTTTIPPEIIAAISEPFKLNNSLLASIDANMANVHSISANALAQLVMIQSNTYNTAMATRDAVEELRGVISPGHPRGGNGIKVWA